MNTKMAALNPFTFIPKLSDVTQLDILRSLIEHAEISNVFGDNPLPGSRFGDLDVETVEKQRFDELSDTSEDSRLQQLIIEQHQLLEPENNGIPETAPGSHLSVVGQAAVRYTLTRMASTPATPTNAATLVSSLLGNLTQQQHHHRRLERTQSAPAPASALPAQAQAAVNTSRYKTELCRPYEEFGVCKYGDKCQFAHGMNELRNLARHPKYKTELCRTYHTVGFCPYGPRCHFVHNQEEVMQHSPPPPARGAAMMASVRSTAMAMARARPAALSPALSIDSASSPPCSLSQSPTSSMGSFFSSEPELHSPGVEEQRLPVFNKLSAPAPLLALGELY